MSCAIGNVLFAVLAGQPLVILGTSWPLAMFEKILFLFSEKYNYPFLQFRFWIGIWVGIFCVVIIATNASYLVRLLTRFTKETFSVVLSLVFIFKAFEKVWLINWNSPFSPWILYPTVPRDCKCEWIDSDGYNVSRHYLELFNNHDNLTNQHGRYYTCRDYNRLAKPVGQCPEFYEDNKFVWSIVLFFGTYFVIRMIKRIRNSPYFMAWVSGQPNARGLV